MTKAYAFAGTTMTVLVPGETTNNAFAMLHVIKPNGSSTPPHSHDQEAELSYVLSGSLGVETQGREAQIQAGNAVLLPPGRPHRLFNNSGAEVREFLLCAPAVFDKFVAAAGVPTDPYAQPRPMTDEDRQRLVGLAPEYRIRLLRSAAAPDVGVERPPAAPERIDMLGARLQLLARFGDDDADLVILRENWPCGRALPLHDHADPKGLFVLAGELEIYSQGSNSGFRKRGPEEAFYIAPELRHAVRNNGTTPAELLTVTTSRMWNFFKTIGTEAIGTDPQPASPEELAAFASRVTAVEYGLVL